MSEHARVAVIAGLTTFVVRIAIGLLIMGLDRRTGEADMLLFFDLPTLALYFLLAKAGYPHDIVNSYDVRFFITGSLVWLLLGCGIGWLTSRLRSKPDRSTSLY